MAHVSFAGGEMLLTKLILPGETIKWLLKDVDDFLRSRFKVLSFPDRHDSLEQLQNKTKNMAQNINTLPSTAAAGRRHWYLEGSQVFPLLLCGLAAAMVSTKGGQGALGQDVGKETTTGDIGACIFCGLSEAPSSSYRLELLASANLTISYGKMVKSAVKRTLAQLACYHEANSAVPYGEDKEDKAGPLQDALTGPVVLAAASKDKEVYGREEGNTSDDGDFTQDEEQEDEQED
ncbi:hypothetical protein BDK51DRAFT_33859 [Blyttiomyces helicus]|uniref:Uncharacterized protein n=1 Tax=Blyttiomyces helicus TaxID=388810 RepID=A0A4P9WI89_9FUNG|nr:hypothetical protein BDK51DRAFT_33859 [Blyttiomyces helicus]|eukprot:RKO92571.1 hypothetical protein BDK51DRAFT_33859 [Blyttiomyces helicus]